MGRLLKNHLPHIGLRKIKSLISVCMAFAVWQLLRLVIPYELDAHPLFGYIYAIIEIRETSEKTKQFSLYRIKATLIGLAMGLVLLPVSVCFGNHIDSQFLMLLADLGLILCGTLAALCVAELCKCKNLCGIAAIVFVTCIVQDRNSNTNIYVYAVLRAIQTIVGVFSAWLVNTYFLKGIGHKEQ